MSVIVKGSSRKKDDIDWLFYYRIGYIYKCTHNSNPSELFGGVWQPWGMGRSSLGVSATYPANTRHGAASVVLTTAQMPSHTHSGQRVQLSRATGANTEGSGTVQRRSMTPNGESGATSNTNMGTVNSSGSNHAHNNMSPFKVVYKWKRIS